MTPALQRAVERWRVQAWAIVGNPAYSHRLQQLAWRFLVQHGLA